MKHPIEVNSPTHLTLIQPCPPPSCPAISSYLFDFLAPLAHVPSLQGPCLIAFASCTDSSLIWTRSEQLRIIFVNHKFEVWKTPQFAHSRPWAGLSPLFPRQLDRWPRSHELHRKEASISSPNITTVFPFSFVNIAQDERILRGNTAEISPFLKSFFTIVKRLPRIYLFDPRLNIWKNSMCG